MKRILAVFFLVCSGGLMAQSPQSSAFHVRNQHVATQNEETTFKDSKFIHSLITVGTFNGKLYTLTAADAGWNKLEIGHDYVAYEKKSKWSSGIVIETTDSKGRKNQTKWEILSVEELPGGEQKR